MMIDRILYRLGLVRRSHYTRLRALCLNVISDQAIMKAQMKSFEERFSAPPPAPPMRHPMPYMPPMPEHLKPKPDSHLKVIK